MAAQVVKCGECGRKNRVPAVAAGVPHCGHCHRPLPWVAEAGDEDFAEVALRATTPVLVDFWAPWCGPCRMVTPILEHLTADLPGRLKLVRTNVDLAPRVAERFDVQHIPTLMIVHRGEVVARRSGADPGSVLREWVEQALGRLDEPVRHGSRP